MRISKRAVFAVIASIIAVGIIVTVGVGVGIVKLWPVARGWAQTALGVSDIESARRAVAQVGAQLGSEQIVQLSRAGAGAAGLAALAGNPELAQVLKWTAALPALGPLLQSGAYQKALEEAVRQKVANISQISLDQVASPDVRAALAEVQQAVAKSPQGAEAASAVNANVLSLLKSEAFARLRQSADFSRYLSGSEPASEGE